MGRVVLGRPKTTVVQEVGTQAEKDKLFEEIVFVEVTETLDIKKLQTEIVDKLDLTFNNESERASKLYERLKRGKRILLILDNIWKDLDLKTIGIPSKMDHEGCKLLLTTRNLDVLQKMDSTNNFEMDILNEEEAWTLFKKITVMAGMMTWETVVLLVITWALSQCVVFADDTTNFVGNVGFSPDNRNFYVNDSQESANITMVYTAIKLSQPGTRFFISGGPADCKMKLYIDVYPRTRLTTRLTTVKTSSCCSQQELLFPPVVKQMGAKFMFLFTLYSSFTYAAPITHHDSYTSGRRLGSNILQQAYYAMFLLIQHLSFANAAPTTPKIYNVGDSSGWNLGSNVEQWADSNTFFVGDTLVFKYTAELDVVEVGQLGYSYCDTTNAIQVHNNGITRIELTKPGPRFFVCSQDCKNGLKMVVDVHP